MQSDMPCSIMLNSHVRGGHALQRNFINVDASMPHTYILLHTILIVCISINV